MTSNVMRVVTLCAFFILAQVAFGQDAAQMPNLCSNKSAITTISADAWNGWGAGPSNSRYQGQPLQVSQLKLKWAFGFPGAKAVSGQPAIAAGRVFVSADNGYVYSLDAATGCVYWSFHAEAAIRSSMTIERPAGARYAAYFGDAKANVYAVDASNGTLIWKVHV